MTNELYDRQREARITALGRQCIAAVKAGDTEEARRLNKELVAAIDARSPQQVALMEQKAGLR